MKNLKRVPKKEFISFVNSIEYIFLDVDGVLSLAGAKIPGSDACVNNLRKLAKKISIVSNNSALPKKMSVAQLKDFEIVEEEVTTASEPAINYLKNNNFVTKDIYVISGANMKEMLKKEGFNVINDQLPKEFTEETTVAVKNDCLQTIKQCSNVGAVIADPDIKVSNAKLNRAITILNHNPDAIFLYGASDEYISIHKDILILGFKFVIDAIKELTNRKGISYAKPSMLLADHLNKKYEILDPQKVLFVGDYLDVDIVFGNHAGYRTLLVLSGVTHEEQVKNLEAANDDEATKPDFYVKNLDALNEMLKEYCLGEPRLKI